MVAAGIWRPRKTEWRWCSAQCSKTTTTSSSAKSSCRCVWGHIYWFLLSLLSSFSIRTYSDQLATTRLGWTSREEYTCFYDWSVAIYQTWGITALFFYTHFLCCWVSKKMVLILTSQSVAWGLMMTHFSTCLEPLQSRYFKSTWFQVNGKPWKQ